MFSYVFYPAIDKFFGNRFETYNENSTSAADKFNVEFVDSLHVNLKCCGWESDQIFENRTMLPLSCCSTFGKESAESRLLNPPRCDKSSYEIGCEVVNTTFKMSLKWHIIARTFNLCEELNLKWRSTLFRCFDWKFHLERYKWLLRNIKNCTCKL